MQTLKNTRLLSALSREPVDVTPIWIMRQAGRYLPEYRKTRAQAGSFMQLCQTPELAATVTLQPIARYPLDAAIIFSDILTIPDAMGLGLYFQEGEGPHFQHPVQTCAAIEKLALPDLDNLNYVYEAIKLVKQELNGKVPLIGFCGSPFTLAAYMTEGRGKTGFPLIQKMMREEPNTLHTLLNLLADAVALHLNAQVKAGCDVAMVFDTWGGLLNTSDYQTFSLPYLSMIVGKLERKVPVILFTKGSGKWLKLMAETGCDALGIDWETSLKDGRNMVGDQVALQGNMNPNILLQSEEVIRAEVARILSSYGSGSGHVFNLGHGITPDVPPENVSILVDAVHELSADYHR